MIVPVPDDPNRVRFSHALVRDTVYESMPAGERRQLHGRAGHSLEAEVDRVLEPDYSGLAYHFSIAAPEAGAVERALKYGLRAARGASAMLAYEEAAEQCDRSLRLLDRYGENDPALRVELLLELGEAQSASGDSDAARESFAQAASLTGRHFRPDLLARAAIGYVSYWADLTRVEAFRDPAFQRVGADLLQRALDALPDGVSAERARLTAHLACVLGPGRLDLSQRAVEMSRQLDDPALTTEVLAARRDVLSSPDLIEERLALTADIIRFAEQSRDPELSVMGRVWRLRDLLELGDLAAAKADLQVCEQKAEALRQPRLIYVVLVLRAAVALLTSRFDEGERLAIQAFDLGCRFKYPLVGLVFAAQLITVRRQQGRLHESERAVRSFIAALPPVVSVRCITAYFDAELGHLNAARRELDSLARDEFAGVPRDRAWLAHMALLTNVVVFLEDRTRAKLLLDQLAPFEGRNVVAGDGIVSFGALDFQLGWLATLLERWDEADRYFRNARALNERIDARAYLGHILSGHAAMLLLRGAAGDATRALGMIDEGLAITDQYGMPELRARFLEHREAAEGAQRVAR
jgi:hypothetical protein